MRVDLERMPDVGAIYRKALGQALPLPRGLGWGGRRAPRPDTLPDTEYAVAGVAVDRDRLAAYDRVCGFPLRDPLPATYPHVLAFPLAMTLMAADDFPFPMVGLVHVANRIEVRRPLTADAPLTITATARDLRSHPRGRQFDVAVSVADPDGPAWSGVSTYLRREARPGEEGPRPGGGEPAAEVPALPPVARWRVPTRTGTEYAAVSGDRNPIHTSTVGARLFGFRRPIAHGMWSKARCIAALDGRLPAAFRADVRFHAPILLPSTVLFAAAHGPAWRLALTRPDAERPHLTAEISPLP